jgi:DNA-binding winged helix-turn-helix (wHTH) protein
MRALFGECELDTGQRLLLRHGSVSPLSARAYQLLELLLDRRPEAVAKNELVEHLWPATFVSDASLHNLVAEVRAAIGDSPRAPRYIRTIPRYGYAFKGDVRLAPALNVPGPSAPGPRLISKRGEWVLGEGTALVGRDRDCAVRVDAHSVSRRHARIAVTADQTTLEDLGSKNGTLVNGTRITQPVALKDGDEIHIGSFLVTYRLIDLMPSTRTLPRRG